MRTSRLFPTLDTYAIDLRTLKYPKVGFLYLVFVFYINICKLSPLSPSVRQDGQSDHVIPNHERSHVAHGR